MCSALSVVTAEQSPLLPALRLRHIDALRAVAALLVLWRHAGDQFSYLNQPTGLRGVAVQEFIAALNVGHIGVVTFFLISGFVVPFSLHAQQPAPLRSFALQRFFRIFPAYWLSIPLGALTGFWIWGSAFHAGELLVNFSLLQNLFGVRSAEGLYWTLLIELVFYVLCVLLFCVNSLDKPRRVLGVAVGLAGMHLFAEILRVIGRPSIESQWSYNCLNLSFMLLGTVYRQLLSKVATHTDRMASIATLGLLVLYLVVLPMLTVPSVGFLRNAYVAYALGLLLFLAGERWCQLRTRVTDWLGAISYSIYLFHPVVFMSLFWLLLRLPADSIWRTQHLAIYLLLTLALTLLVAHAAYRWVEQPGILLGKRCVAWVQRKHRLQRARAAEPLAHT